MLNPKQIENLQNKTKTELLQLAELTAALKEKRKYRYLDFVFPETGKYSRYAYPKAMEYYAAGKDHRFRMLAGANGVGKSHNIYTEAVYHWTGDYPEWWTGCVQEIPKHWWILIESGGTFKSSGQRLLLGDIGGEDPMGGTGLIPRENIVDIKAMPGVSGAIGTILIRHKKGHIVTIEVKASEQKRENLQAANLDGLLEDEEPPSDVHIECLMRLRGSPTKPPGILMIGYTPIKGITDVTLSFAPNGVFPNGEHPDDKTKYVVRIEMDEVPHLSDEDKDMYLKNCSPAEMEARTKGLIALGSGKIYPIPESQVFVEPFKIPEYWPRAFSLDFGWHCTCVLWGAKDPLSNTLYIYSEYYQGHESAQIHALNIKAKGDWIPGCCDPSGGGRNEDGKLMIDTYRGFGIRLLPANNAIQAGISRVLDRLQCGTLKIFNNLPNTLKEYRLYRYDSKDPNVPAPNQADHSMDNLKYITSEFDRVSVTQEEVERFNSKDDDYEDRKKNKGRDSLCGY